MTKEAATRGIMSRQQAINLFRKSAAKYKLQIIEPGNERDIPCIHRADNAYIDFTIRLVEDFQSFDDVMKTGTCRIEVKAHVCRMNPNRDAVELLQAADEIRNAAHFVSEMEARSLSWIQQY